jgi:hypothetical protein
MTNSIQQSTSVLKLRNTQEKGSAFFFGGGGPKIVLYLQSINLDFSKLGEPALNYT